MVGGGGGGGSSRSCWGSRSGCPLPGQLKLVQQSVLRANIADAANLRIEEVACADLYQILEKILKGMIGKGFRDDMSCIELSCVQSS